MPPNRSTTPPPRPPTSQLAVASLICALLLLCPLTSAVAVILGTVALRRIRLSAGRLGGRRLALAGTLIGSASLVIQGYVLIRLADWQLRMIDERAIACMTSFVRAAQDRDLAAARSLLSASMAGQVTDAQIIEFGEEVTQAYGRLDGFRITQRDVHGGLGTSRAEVAGFFTFNGRQQPGSARLLLGPAGVDFTPSLLLDYLIMTDASRGTISLPPPAQDNPPDGAKPAAPDSQESAGGRTMPPSKE